MPYEPADHPASKYWARVALLEAVKELKPEVLSELKDFSEFFQLALPHLQEHHGQRLDLWVWDLTESTRPHATVLQLRWAITAWAKKHNLNFDWCIGCALHSLVQWNSNEGSFKYGWSYDGLGHVAPVNDEEIRFSFELEEGWRPDLEGQETFTKRASEAFKKELVAYTTRLISLLGQRNQVKTRAKYKPLVDDYSDFTLVALRLVTRLGYKEILKSVIAAQKKRKMKKLTTYKALESRIRRTAELCGIDPGILKH
jgi:hypothetical protein